MEATDPSYSYEGGTLIHTDPATGFVYKWDAEEKKWIPKTSAPVDPPGNGAGESSSAAAPEGYNYEKVGDTYIYKNPNTGQVLEWDLQVKEWRPKVQRRVRHDSNEEEFDSDDDKEAERVRLQQKKDDISLNVQVHPDGTRTYTDPADGTVFEWDAEKKAWFPRLDDEFIARYQLSYGDSTATTAEAQPETVDKEKQEESRPNKEKKSASDPPTWFEVDDSKNTKVYVTNLPLDIDEQKLADFMQKCGLIEKDLETGKLKIKLYRDANGEVKGDALCTYIKVTCFIYSYIVFGGLIGNLNLNWRGFGKRQLANVVEGPCAEFVIPFVRLLWVHVDAVPFAANLGLVTKTLEIHAVSSSTPDPLLTAPVVHPSDPAFQARCLQRV